MGDIEEKIYFIVKGHTLEHDVQTIIQVFYPNLHYYSTGAPKLDTLTVESSLDDEKATAKLYENGVMSCSYVEPVTEELTEKEKKRCIKASIYHMLKEKLHMRPQWGFITGVRPAKTMNELLDKGYTEEECLAYFTQRYDVMPQKAQLSLEVAKAERGLLAKNDPRDASIYIGIPFCPTRCLYCSFTSYPLSQYQNRVDDYLKALEKELKYLGDYAKHFHIKNVYIGGGTPTSLNEEQMEKLLCRVQECFPMNPDVEFTVEAGRPDTITKEKLKLMKIYGVNRISINPQTMNEATLEAIGRKHKVADVWRVFMQAREIGHDTINMDLILGLPDEKVKQVEHTMQEIMKMSPENLTIHTLAVKRASRLKENFGSYTMTDSLEMEQMLEVSAAYAYEMDMRPYYMYRQKNMVGNFENVGYCKPQKECAYNVQIMEETQTILGAGAGASTKTIDFSTNRIERIFNVKSVEDYIGRIDEMIHRKKEGLPVERF